MRGARRIAALVLFGIVSAPALAGPGDHVRVGQTTIVPSVRAAVAFESNPYRSPTNPQLAAHFALTPSLTVSTRGADVHVDLGGRYLLQKYFQRDQFNLDRFSNFDLEGRLQLFPQRTVSFVLADKAALRSRNTERPGAAIAYYNHFRNQLDGSLVLRAGPVLTIAPGGGYIYDRYLTADFSGQSLLKPFNTRHIAGPSLRAEWDFFPQTTLVFDGDYTWNRWMQNWVPTGNPSSELGSFLALPDSEQWRARIGLRGRLTSRLVLVANVGFGQARYDEQSVVDEGGDATGVEADLLDARGVLAQVQLGWEIGPDQEVRIGYQRDFTDAWFSNYLAYDEVYTGATIRVGTRLQLEGLAKLRFEEYVGAVVRSDRLILGHLGASYFLTDWVSVDLGGNVSERFSTGQRVNFFNAGGNLGATFTY